MKINLKRHPFTFMNEKQYKCRPVAVRFIRFRKGGKIISCTIRTIKRTGRPGLFGRRPGKIIGGHTGVFSIVSAVFL